MDSTTAPHVLRYGDLLINMETYKVLLAGYPIGLSYREYALLAYLATRPGQVVSKRRLLEEGLGRHDPEGLRLVDIRVRHLQQLLDQGGVRWIEEVPGEGYRFAPKLHSDNA